jgi:hypothetical protein
MAKLEGIVQGRVVVDVNRLTAPPSFAALRSLLRSAPRYADRAGLRVWMAAELSILGSGLIDHIQKMTMAAMAMADMNVWAQRS